MKTDFDHHSAHYSLATETTYLSSGPARLIRLMCKHFSRKVDVHWDENRGFVQFAEGVCVMQAFENSLALRCAANTDDDLLAIVETINRHIGGFSIDDVVELNWSPL